MALKHYGSISKLVALLFSKDSQDLTLQPNQSTTYTAARSFAMPPGDVSHILVSASSTQTLTGKTIDGDDNTIQDLAVSSLKTVVGNANKVVTFNGSGAPTAAQIVNANVDAAAAIVYSKLSLTGSIVNADINASAAIAYSKLNLSGSIVNADINASAAIAYSKLNLSASIVNADIASGANIDAAKLGTGSVSNTEFGYLDGVTSAIQTQIDSKVAKAGDIMTGDLTMDNQKGIKFREGTGGGTNFIYMRAPSTLAGDLNLILPNSAGTSGYVLSTDGSGNLSWVSNSSTLSYKDTWLAADTATKVITHNLGTTDVIVQIFDIADGSTISIDSIVRTDANTLTVTASEAPGVSWRVLILAI